MIRRASNRGAILLAFVGVVWFLQGIGLIRGGNMTDQFLWAIFGVFAVAAAAGLLVYNCRRSMG